MNKPMMGRVFFILILLVIDWYVFQSVKTAMAGRDNFWSQLLFYAYWAVSLITICLLIAGGITDHHFWPKTFKQYAFGILGTLYIAKLFVLPFVLIDDAIRGIRWLLSFVNIQSSVSESKKVVGGITRSKFIHTLAMYVAAVPFFTMLYGMMNGKYNFRIRRQRLKFASLPEAFHGMRVVQISDVHIGSFMDKEPIRRAMQMIMDGKPDLILFTGDLVNDLSSELDGFTDVLSMLNAPLGVYSVLGNHDYGDYVAWNSMADKAQNLDRLKNLQKQMGWKLLLNENVRIEKDGSFIQLIGIENWSAIGRFPKYGDMEKAMQGVDESSFKILMSHDPSHWDHQVQRQYRSINLTLSGHTHGMQFGVEIPGFRWSPVQYVYKNWAGLYGEGEQRLYVNRGLGFIGYPGRVGILPEITVIELEKAEAAG
jgi:predicted MPP superfamily phosphohydrolase